MNIFVIIAILWGVVIITLLAIHLYNTRQFKKKINQGHIQIAGAQDKKDRTFILYHIYRTLPFLSKDYGYIETKIRLLYPADEISIRIEATRTITKALVKATLLFLTILALSTVSLFVTGGVPYFYLLLGLLLAYRTYKKTTKTRLEKAENRLLQQYSTFLFNDLMPAYQRHHGRLDDALFYTIDSLPIMMALHVTRILDVVKSPHLEEAAAEYAEYAPNNFFTSLVSLIVPTRLYGDKTLNDGKTTFMKGVMNLNKQLNEELIMRQRLDAAFASLNWITLMGIFAMQPLYWFFGHFMPQTKVFFDSGLGLTAEVLIFIITFLADYLLDSLKSTARSEIKEDSVWKHIADLPVFTPILNIQYKKYYTFMKRTEKQMQSVGDHTGVKAKIVECMVFAIGAFLVVNFLFTASTIQKSQNAINDFSNAFTNVITPSNAYNKQMEMISRTMSKQYQNEYLTVADTDRIKEDIRTQDSVIKADTYVDPTAAAIIEHNQIYHNTYFRAWYEIVALIISIIAFNVPLRILRFKSKAAQMGKEDEVNSFNLLATIFMDMDGIHVDTLLEWMERFSYFYRQAVFNCIVAYPMGKQKALETLKQYDSLPTFERFCESMINVDEVGMKRAFADIEIQQDFYNDKRRADNEVLIMRKRNFASMIAFIPFYVTLGLWIGGPIVVYAIQLIKQFMSQINSLGV